MGNPVTVSSKPNPFPYSFDPIIEDWLNARLGLFKRLGVEIIFSRNATLEFPEIYFMVTHSRCIDENWMEWFGIQNELEILRMDASVGIENKLCRARQGYRIWKILY